MRNRDVETIQLVIGALSNITFPTCAGAGTSCRREILSIVTTR